MTAADTHLIVGLIVGRISVVVISRSGESAEAEGIIPNRAPAGIPAESETKAQAEPAEPKPKRPESRAETAESKART